MAATYPFHPTPPPHLTFNPMPPPPFYNKPTLKRPRPLSDIEGLGPDSRDYNKKRRLRLTLITSRLSAPFAIPPTNIINRRTTCPRISRRLPRAALRKAAILNKIKRDAMAAREAQERVVELARREFRERLATAAHSSFQREDDERRTRPMVKRRPPPPPTSPPPAQRKGTHRQQPRSAENWMQQQRRSTTADPFDSLPSYLRPPSPPSESELNRERRGMGLDIGCC